MGVGRITFHMASLEGIRDNNTEQFIRKVGKESLDEMNRTTLRNLARHDVRHRMAIALENRDQGQVADYCKTIGILRSMIKRDGEPNLGICLDSGHTNTHGDLDCAQMILEAEERLIDTHFHDNFGYLCNGKILGSGVINNLHRPPGIGTINWLAVIDALEEINYKRPIMFEASLHTKEDDQGTSDVLREGFSSFVGMCRNPYRGIDTESRVTHENAMATARTKGSCLDFRAQVTIYGSRHQVILQISSIKQKEWMISPLV